MKQKLTLLVEATNTLDMKLHPTKFFANNTRDRDSFHIGNIVVAYTENYPYLGSQSPMQNEKTNI